MFAVIASKVEATTQTRKQTASKFNYKNNDGQFIYIKKKPRN
jgi:hypothetical protein